GFGDAELVNARTHDAQCALECVVDVGHLLLRLVNLEGEVHTTAQIETVLEWDLRVGGIHHYAVARDAIFDGPRKQREDRCDDHRGDHKKACLQGVHH